MKLSNIYNGLQFIKPESERTIKDIIDAFDRFTVGETNETYERFVLISTANKKVSHLKFTYANLSNHVTIVIRA